MQDQGGSRRVTLELRSEPDSIAGTLIDEGGTVRPFSGWLELIAALGRVSERSGRRATDKPGGERS